MSDIINHGWTILVFDVTFREDHGEPNIEEFREAVGLFDTYEAAEKFADDNNLNRGDLEEDGEAQRCSFVCLRREPHLSKE